MCIRDSQNIILYAGDYWYVWPSVMADLIDGRESYGLTMRAEGNKQKLENAFMEQFALAGELQVGCLKASLTTCQTQVQRILDNVSLEKFQILHDGYFVMIFSQTRTE